MAKISSFDNEKIDKPASGILESANILLKMTETALEIDKKIMADLLELRSVADKKYHLALDWCIQENESHIKDMEKILNMATNNLQNEVPKESKPSCVVSWKQVGEMSGDCTCSYSIELKPNTLLKEFIDYILSNKQEWGYLRLFGKCHVEYSKGEIIEENLLLPFYDRKIKKVTGDGGYSRMDYYITLE